MKRLLLVLSLLYYSTPALLAEIVILDGPVGQEKPKAVRDKPAIGVPQPKERETAKATTATRKTDALRFMNRDQLQGTLNSITADGIVWQSTEAAAPITFATTNVDDIRLESNGMPRDAGADFQIRLSTDDELCGQILELNSSELTLETWYAGVLKIPRGLIAKITPLKRSGGGNL